MQIQHHRIPAPADLFEDGRSRPSFAAGPRTRAQDQSLVDGRMVGENGGERGFAEDVEVEIRPPAMQGFEQRQG